VAGNPRQPGIQHDPSLHPDPSPGASFTESFGETVDELRQIYTDMGLRPYRIVSVLAEWSGRKVGVGTVRIVREREYLPTPKLDLGGTRTTPRNAGKVEEGGAWLTEVSPRLTEDEVLNLAAPDGLGAGQECYLEARIDGRDGSTRRRRYNVSGVPERRAGEFDWKVKLTRARADRTRAGAPNERTAQPERIRNPLMDPEG
jgi:hypothetical protein